MRVTVILVLLAASANAATVHALGPPTPKAIKAVLEKGFEFDAGDNHYSFEARGRVSGSGPYAAQGKGRYTVSGDSVSVSGSGTMACMGDDDCGGSPLSWSFSLDFVVIAAGETSLVLRIENESSTMMTASRSPQLVGRGLEPSEYEVVVHLVPGAKDERLLTAASKLIEGLSAESADGYLFVRGAPAANVRTVSEIFFGPKSETTARAIARKLEPVLGPITVKPWPGQTTFQVVVVLGDTKAK